MIQVRTLLTASILAASLGAAQAQTPAPAAVVPMPAAMPMGAAGGQGMGGDMGKMMEGMMPTMRYKLFGTLGAAGFFAMAAMAPPIFANPPGEASSVMLAQATTTPAPTTPPAVGGQQQPPGTTTTMPGQMMEHGKGMGPMMGGPAAHPGPMGEMPPCPAGKTMSGTPPTCQ